MDEVELVDAAFIVTASQKPVDSQSSTLKGPGIAWVVQAAGQHCCSSKMCWFWRDSSYRSLR